MTASQRRRAIVLLCVAAAVHTLCLAWFLVRPDLNLDYAFMGGDSFDWISQALYDAGADVRNPGRPPLFPLMMAGLERLSLLNITPALLQFLVVAAAVVMYRTLAKDFSDRIAMTGAVAFFVNYAWRSLGLEIMADVPAACLMLFALSCFRSGLDRPRRLVPAGFWGGSAAVTQPIVLAVLVPMGLAMALHRRRELRSRWPWFGLAAFVGPTVLWPVVSRLWFGPVGSGPLHWALVGLHWDSAPFYVWTGLGFLGVPGAVLAVWGLLRAVRSLHRDPWCLVLVAGAMGFGAFFGLFYGFTAKRFLVYGFVFVPFFWAWALAHVRRPAVQTVLAVLLIGWSWLPSPNGGRSARGIAVWPAPTTEFVAASIQRVRGDQRPDFGRISIEIGGVPWRWSVLDRARAAGRKRPTVNRVQVHQGDRSVVLLASSPAALKGRYSATIRLGNALRRRVKFVPREVLEPWVDGLPRRRAGRVGKWNVERTELPGVEGTFLLASERSGGAVERQVGRPGLDRRSAATVAAVAKGVVTELPVTDDVVAVVTASGRNDELLTYLAFLVPSTNFYVLTSDDPAATLRDLGCTRPILLDRAEEIVVAPCTLMHYRATVVMLP